MLDISGLLASKLPMMASDKLPNFGGLKVE
jgi:hypothetical protein